MADEDHPFETRFRPLRPASRRTLIAAMTVGPLLWVVALVVVAALANRTDAIGFALLIAAASFVIGFVGLAVLRRARTREERRYAAGR
jgi:uncharacterized membrane protein (DUF485 family)